MKNLTFLLAVFILLPSGVQAQGSLAKGAAKATLTRSAVQEAVDKVIAQQAVRDVTRVAITGAALNIPDVITPKNYTLGAAYPNRDVISLYKKAAEEIDVEISAKDVTEAPFYLPEQLREEYAGLTEQMRDISWRMKQYAQNKLRNKQILSQETHELLDQATALNIKMDAVQRRLSFLAKGITTTQQNIALFKSVVNREPIKEFPWQNPLPYDFHAFSLQSSLINNTFKPTMFEMESALAPAQKARFVPVLQKQLHVDLPAGTDKVSIAVVNDESDMFYAFSDAKDLGYIPAFYDIVYFTNVTDFLAAHKQTPFNMIFTDYFVPGGSGDMIVKQLRKGLLSGKVDQTPIIFNSKMRLYPDQVKQLYNEGYSAHFPASREVTPEIAALALRDYLQRVKQNKLPPLDFHLP
jgi:CheY-like chemotaxis protein